MSKFEGIKKPNFLPKLLFIRRMKASKLTKYACRFSRTCLSFKLPAERVSLSIKNDFSAIFEI